jgi:hypothetical protein
MPSASVLWCWSNFCVRAETSDSWTSIGSDICESLSEKRTIETVG